jgi:hypothetical protein
MKRINLVSQLGKSVFSKEHWTVNLLLASPTALHLESDPAQPRAYGLEYLIALHPFLRQIRTQLTFAVDENRDDLGDEIRGRLRDRKRRKPYCCHALWSLGAVELPCAPTPQANATRQSRIRTHPVYYVGHGGPTLRGPLTAPGWPVRRVRGRSLARRLCGRAPQPGAPWCAAALRCASGRAAPRAGA